MCKLLQQASIVSTAFGYMGCMRIFREPRYCNESFQPVNGITKALAAWAVGAGWLEYVKSAVGARGPWMEMYL